MAGGYAKIEIQTDNKAKFFSLVVLVLLLMTIWYMLDLALLTFVMTFVFYYFLKWAQKKWRILFPVSLPDHIMLTLLYIFFVAVVGTASYAVAPKIIVQLTDLATIFSSFDVNGLRDSLDFKVVALIEQVDFNQYVAQAGNLLALTAPKLGGFGLNTFLAFILSYLLLLEKSEIQKFGDKLQTSKISFIYEYFIYFGGNFVKTFAKVMKVQVTIAFINCIVSMIILAALGFPQVLGLGFMIFIFGLVPVAGVVISLIPLTIIAFKIGGISKVIGVVVMIVVIHALEAYVLNPKLMANKTKLPVCLIFIILLVSEHYLGVWGLLIGVPLFIFLLDMLGVEYGKPSKENITADELV